MDIYRKQIDFGGRPLTFETGRFARQADGAVMVTYGQTSVLCTAVGAKKMAEKPSFFPLTIQYQEKTYAAGRIPGGFFKREGRPSEHETLTSRLIDRPLRPLFAPGYLNETQVICTVVSQDDENQADIVALIGASAALTLSGLPFMGPVGGARVGYKDGSYILNPSIEEIKTSDMDLIVAGTREGVLMVESEIKELSEDVALGGVKFAHEAYAPVIEAIIELAEHAAKDPMELPEANPHTQAITDAVAASGKTILEAAYGIQKKQDRCTALEAARAEIMDSVSPNFDETLTGDIKSAIKKLEAHVVRSSLFATKTRIDGRGLSDVRKITCDAGIIPLTHGSALFTRGETQALAVATLGTGVDEQLMDTLTSTYKEHFMLHYNFPPFSVGETGRLGSPGRREIGHGKLAWRALRPMLPSREDCPYVIRLVSEILESNGSSSMATVCGSSLALMDAGVPLKKPVAGIAMGLVKEDSDFVVLSDILGDEDSLGDMDFKVAGTENGITALQMDIKITSITFDIMQQALNQAKDGRLHILGEMAKCLETPRDDVSDTAPRIEKIKIPKDKIRDVIGSGGKVIREIIEVTGTTIDIEDDGSVSIAASSKDSIMKAKKWILNLTEDPEIGKIYEGKVVKITDFGAFVNFCGRDGLVHISQLADKRVEKVTDVVAEGDMVKVKMIGFDRGKVKLSMKEAQ
jgi:polyribonucleotide nucleotidyltransferase